MPLNTRLSVDLNEDGLKFMEWSVGLNKKINLKKCMALPVYGGQQDLDLRNLIKVSGMKAKKALVNISDQRLITRIVKVPYMEEKDLASFVEMEINDFLLVDLDSFDYDYRVLKKFEEEGRDYYNLLLAGAPKSVIEDWVKVIQAAGLIPLAIDIYPNNISRLFKELKEVDVAVLDIGRSNTHLTVFEKGVLFLYACIPGGHGGIKEVAEEGLPEGMEAVFNDVRAYLNFYSSRHFGREVDEVYLINDLFLVPGARQMVTDALSREVTCDIPAWCYTRINRSDVVEVIPAYATNLGLIMRGMKI